MDPKRRSALTHSIVALVAAMAVWFGKGAVTPPPVTTKPDSTVAGAPPVTTPPDTTSTVTPPPVTGSYVAVFKEDFTEDKSTADFLTHVSKNIGGTGTSTLLFTDGANPTLASIDETVQYNGHHTLKYNQPNSVPNTPELWSGITPLSHAWARAHIRWTPGWTTTGTGQTYGDGGKLVTSSAAYKALGWNYHGVDGSGRIEITNGTQYQDYWSMNNKDGTKASNGCNSADLGQKTTVVTTEWTDGLWYTYIVEIDNTQPTGIARFYMAKGNATPTLKLTCPATMLAGGLVPPIDAFNWGMNYNQVRKPDQTQSLNYGDMEIVDGSKYANPYAVAQ